MKTIEKIISFIPPSPLITIPLKKAIAEIRSRAIVQIIKIT